MLNDFINEETTILMDENDTTSEFSYYSSSMTLGHDFDGELSK